jgi:hypothetical protein
LKKVSRSLPGWVGKRVYCKKCMQNYQLESRDQGKIKSKPHLGAVARFVECPKCETHMLFDATHKLLE